MTMTDAELIAALAREGERQVRQLARRNRASWPRRKAFHAAHELTPFARQYSGRDDVFSITCGKCGMTHCDQYEICRRKNCTIWQPKGSAA